MDAASLSRFRVLSLNCWGISIKGFQSKLRKERMAAIGQHVFDASYELVVLQEVWSQNDYAGLCCKLHEKLPFSHYFHSGYTGSGVCVFSKYPILETMWHTYLMNGYAHKFYHGDWYGAKGVGLCKLKVGQLYVHLYATHVHARYSFDEAEEYLAHRTTQMLSLSQFIKHTSEACDAVLLCGDLNTEDTELGYQLLRSNALLKDAWAEKNPTAEGNVNSQGATCDKPDNPFVNAATLKHRPAGMRIDYIMYRNNAQTELSCSNCMVTMGQVPDQPYFYSDHEAVLATFVLKRNVTVRQQPEGDDVVRSECLKRTAALLDEAVRTCRHRRAQLAVLAILWLVALVVAREPYLSHGWHVVNELVQVVAAVLAAACGWIALVLLPVDYSCLLQHRKDVSNAINSEKYLTVDQQQRLHS